MPPTRHRHQRHGMERVETRKARAFEDDGARETVHGWMGRPVELRHDKARDASASDATTVGTHRAQVLGDSTTTEAWKRAHPIARQLCEMDGRARSWRKKLEALRESLKDNLHRKATDPSHPPGMVQGQADEDDRTLRTTTEPDPNRIEAICRGEEEDLEAMACANLYLSWMARGRVPCEDADGHYRPNHHARISKELFVMVEGVEARARARARARMPSTGREAHPTHDAGLEGALARRVSARLPAFDARFTHAEPLTRIRDIAHGKGADGRCDRVRKEIKHTIQNKLHRACGPEDLVASAKMLSKLTAEDADYPQAFVDEFRTFYRELKDFFGASGLRDVLDALGPVLDEEGIRRLDSLREALEHSVHERGKDGPSPDGDGGTDPAPEEGERQPDASGFVHALDVARLSLELRRHVLDAISDRAPVLEDEEADAKGTSCTTRYAMRMADARLEELAFVKLSAVASFLEAARERLLDGTDPSNDGGGNDETDALETPGWSDLVCLEIQALMVGMDHAALMPHLTVPGRSIRQGCASMLREVPGWGRDDTREALMERCDRALGASTPSRIVDGSVAPPRLPPALRAKALFQRARSLSTRHADQLEKVLVPRAESLAVGLKNADSAALLAEAARVHETEVRSDACFAVARLGDEGLATLRALGRVRAGSRHADEPWDAVVVGRSSGRLCVSVTPNGASDVRGRGDSGADGSGGTDRSSSEEGGPPDATPDPRARDGTGGSHGQVLLLGRATGDEDVGADVRGILLRHPIPHLSHLALRARQQGVPMAAADDPQTWDELAALPIGTHVTLSVQGDGEVSLRETSETSNDPDGSPEGPIEAARERSTDAGSSTEAAVDGDIGDVPTDLRVRPMEKETDPVAVHRLAGAKAGHCFTLQRLSRGNGDAGSRIVFRVPRSFFLPQGSMELLLTETERSVAFGELLGSLESARDRSVREGRTLEEGTELGASAARIRAFVSENALLPEATLEPLVEAFGEGTALMVRSSASDEDLPGASAAGLYDSLPALVGRGREAPSPGPRSSTGDLASAVATVWSSLYSERAVRNRLRTGDARRPVRMGVLFQELVRPKVCFVMMTMDPLRDDPNAAYVELARGHGEVLASGAFPGVPVRLRLSKTPGTADYTVLSLDAYNVRLAVQDDGRLQERWAQEDATGNEEWADILEDAVPKLREVCLSLEREFQGPQDVEGCLTEDGEVVVFQTRAQP